MTVTMDSVKPVIDFDGFGDGTSAVCMRSSHNNAQVKAYFTALLVGETLLLTVFTVLDLLLFFFFC